mmetsp:Transcript_83589/g.210677  ORF Transcript_83589/g.210677 Transcript_83589/m.210677 type:complete len:205 (-) Transcript_83589:2-616(-)
MTSSMSFGSMPLSSTSPSSSISSILLTPSDESPADASRALPAVGCVNCCAAEACAWAERSSIFASPNTTYVSDAAALKTSGFEITKSMFLLFFTVTRMIPGTCFMPNFCTALRLFFSALFCLPLSSFDPAPSAASRFGMSSSVSLSSLDSAPSTFSSSGFSSSAACCAFFALAGITDGLWVGPAVAAGARGAGTGGGEGAAGDP